jgi:hypothetical protein
MAVGGTWRAGRSWTPGRWRRPWPGIHGRARAFTKALTVLAAAVVAVFGVAIGLHGTSAPLTRYAPADQIYPNGEKRTRVEIVRYMEDEIMPWARTTLGPLKGGSLRITCETCHGRNPEARDWRMPAVAALPRRMRLQDGNTTASYGRADAQRDHGYVAESTSRPRPVHARIVLPGMAQLLHRPPTISDHAFNRSRQAFGCYHCHRVNW